MATAELRKNRRLLRQEGFRRTLLISAEEALRRGLEEWRLKVLPGHFELKAYRLYPWAYKFRTRRYDERKQRIHGHRKPMVFSGRMRDTLLGGRTYESRVRSRTTQVRLRLPHARAINFWKGKGRKHDFPASIRAMRYQEIRDINRLVGSQWREQVSAEIESARNSPEVRKIAG